MAVRFIIIYFLITMLNVSFGQENLFIPRNFKKAYDFGTRSFDGKPGAEYWQNSAKYKIRADVLPEEFLLTGSEQISYLNNSPDTLKQIVFRLYQNIFRRGTGRDFNFKPDGLTEGVILKKVVVRGREIELSDTKIFNESGTVASLKLEEPLPPHSGLSLSVEWSMEIPFKQTLRMGAYDTTSFFIAYWYPQIAVYDDIDGWDRYPYTGYQEMYNEFSDYEVEITVPENFAVWATGELNNPEQVLAGKYLSRYLAAQSSEEVINVVDTTDLTGDQIFNSDKETNTWKFSAKNVPDFAFAISDRYLWDAVSAVVDSSVMRKVFIQAVYNKDSKDFYSVAGYSKRIIEYLSFEKPDIPYPYSGLVAFNNGKWGGGMEFPMIINNGNSNSADASLRLASHEIAHQYFPFYMGINEKKYAFMDEGWAVFLPFEFQEKNTGDGKDRRQSVVTAYGNFAGKETELPPMTPSILLNGAAYRNSAYDRPAMAYYFLEDVLGKDVFMRALREYINRWNGKHPTPYDFFITFNEVTGQDLSWFWKPWFFERGYPDLELDKVLKQDNGYDIIIKKIGIIPVPIRLKIFYSDDSKEDLYYNASVWKDGIDEITLDVKTQKTIVEADLGGEDIPDSNPENNLIVIH